MKPFQLSREDRLGIIKSQGNRCAICEEELHAENYAMDHCHESGAIRGYLCRACNMGLGHFRDRPDLLLRAAQYLDRAYVSVALSTTKQKLNPPELAKLMRVNPDKVLGWINSGELRAVNVAGRGCKRPRWRIAIEDVALFERAREARKPEPRLRRTRTLPDEVIKYF